MAQRILSLDLATRIGYAHGELGRDPAFGSHTLPSTGDDIGAYLDAFDHWLGPGGHFLDRFHGVDLVVFEAPILPRITSAMTVRKLSALPAFLEWRCRRALVPVRELHLQSIKKFWTGHGRADKARMFEAARDHWGYRGLLDYQTDEVDALGGWWLAHALVAPELQPMRIAPK